MRRPNWPIGGFKDQQMQAAQCTVGSSHFSLQKCRAGATHCGAGETKIDAKKLHSTFLSSGVKLAKMSLILESTHATELSARTSKFFSAQYQVS